jgi:transposase
MRSVALEVCDISRVRTIQQAISYCGLCGDERSSADKAMRMPLSKQRNKILRPILHRNVAHARSEQHR